MSNKIREEDKQALVDLVREEILKYKSGEIDTFTTNQEFGEILNITPKLVSKYICKSSIPEDDMNLRRKSFYRERGKSISLARLHGKKIPLKKELEILYLKNLQPEYQKN